MQSLTEKIDDIFVDAIDVHDTIWYSGTETLMEAITSAIEDEMALLRKQIVAADKTPEYAYSEANANGTLPGVGERWLTPKEIMKDDATLTR